MCILQMKKKRILLHLRMNKTRFIYRDISNTSFYIFKNETKQKLDIMYKKSAFLTTKLGSKSKKHA